MPHIGIKVSNEEKEQIKQIIELLKKNNQGIRVDQSQAIRWCIGLGLKKLTKDC